MVKTQNTTYRDRNFQDKNYQNGAQYFDANFIQSWLMSSNTRVHVTNKFQPDKDLKKKVCYRALETPPRVYRRKKAHMHISLFTSCEYLACSSRLTTNIQFPWLFSAALGTTNWDLVGHIETALPSDCLLARLPARNSSNGFWYLLVWPWEFLKDQNYKTRTFSIGPLDSFFFGPFMYNIPARLLPRLIWIEKFGWILRSQLVGRLVAAVALIRRRVNDVRIRRGQIPVTALGLKFVFKVCFM